MECTTEKNEQVTHCTRFRLEIPPLLHRHGFHESLWRFRGLDFVPLAMKFWLQNVLFDSALFCSFFLVMYHILDEISSWWKSWIVLSYESPSSFMSTDHCNQSCFPCLMLKVVYSSRVNVAVQNSATPSYKANIFHHLLLVFHPALSHRMQHNPKEMDV